MKHILRTALLLLLCLTLYCCLVPAAHADGNVIDSGTCGTNLTWTLYDTGELVISGTGAMANYDAGQAPWYTNRRKITSAVIGDGVTSIGECAVYYCTKLETIEIAQTVHFVGERAFSCCISLTSVTIPEGVTNIGERAFYGCSSLTSVTIPASVTSIGEWAFYNCGKLTDVYYGGSEEQWKLISIGSRNSSLTNATIHYGMIPEAYTVSYDANGGTGAPESQKKTEKISLTLSNDRPTHEKANAGSYTVRLNPNDGSQAVSILRAVKTTSFTFRAWNTAKDGSGTDYAPGASYTVDADLALYAQWDSKTVTAAVTLPELSHAGASFLGWAMSTDAETGITGSYTPTDDVTLYAIWESNTFTVSYNANGGTGAPAAQTKDSGVALTLSDIVPTRANTSAGSYTVTLDANGGSVSPTSLNAARTTSYTFKNWNTAADGSGTGYAPSAAYSTDANVTLYAQWESKTATAAVKLPTPTRDGYVFKGWGTSSTSTSGVTGSYTPTGDVTLYAIWQSPDFILPDSLTTIEAEAFEGGAFTYVQLPEGVSVIRSRAFADCPNLAYIYIPEETGTIARDAFSGVSGLTILGRSGSYAEFYAQRNGIAFVAVE